MKVTGQDIKFRVLLIPKIEAEVQGLRKSYNKQLLIGYKKKVLMIVGYDEYCML